MNLEDKKVKNNKGFSLIELLAAMVILSIIGVLTIVGVAKYIAQSKEQKTIQNEKNVSIAAELYLQANRDQFPKMIGDHKRIQFSALREANYLKEDVTNEKDENCMDESYVLVTKVNENEYTYNTYLYCGDEKADDDPNIPSPFLETISNSEGKSGKIVFSKSSEVKTASFSFKLKGERNNSKTKLASYAYVILGKTNQETEYTELYNSGIIDANGKTTIEFNSRPLSAYIDLPGITSIKIRVTALNENGGYLKYDETISSSNGSNKEDYIDTDDPICPPVYETGSRLGEPTTLDDWVNKQDIGTDRYPRVITLKCDDGNGSGCKRDTFSQAWPNVNDEKQKYGIMFGTIRIEDNAIINKNGVKKSASNKADCDVNVFVDLQAPTVEILPFNPTPTYNCGENGREKCPELVGKDIVFNNEPQEDGKTITVKDPTDPAEDAFESNYLIINTTNYANYHADGHDETEGWLNNEYYPNGIQFKVTISDNLYLDSYTWEVNERWHGTKSSDIQQVYDYRTQDHDEARSWYRRDDPDVDMYVDEQLLYEQKNNYKMKNEKKDIIITLYDEGARYGVLTVKDRAGNETKVYIHANIDRTKPSLSTESSGFLSTNKLNVDENDPLKYTDQKTDGELDYQYEGWDLADGINNPMIIGGFDALFDTEAYKYYSNDYYCWWYECKDRDGGGSYPEGYRPYGTEKDPPYCTPETRNGYGIIEGTPDDEAEIEAKVRGIRSDGKGSGCYKVGVEKGDNQFSGKARVNYEDPAVFNDLVLKNQEYQPGYWSNEELVCGPYQEDMYDNLVTEREGEDPIPNPNNGEEISGWGGMKIRYYGQIGFKDDPEDPSKLMPVQETEYSFQRTINKRDKSQWPRFTEQGVHKLEWANCDAAGNCTDFAAQEYIKIDTIAPQCNNSVRYDEHLNSDGTTGPNHNGWLYDEQVATVYHDCADTSDKTKNNYFEAYLSINSKNKTVEQQLKDPETGIYTYYNEYGSGCVNDGPTAETLDYSTDVYTCSAGTQGIGKGYLGSVIDYAGNERICSVGATVRKDTTPPICATRAYYVGKNGDGQYNKPNVFGWAIDGMKIYTKKSCEDTYFAKGVGIIPGANFYAASGCSSNDDASNDIKVRVQSTYKGYSKTESLPTTVIDGITYFLPNNAAEFQLDYDKDIDGYIGATEPVIENGKTVFKMGFIVDRAGNVSEDSCLAAWVRRDTVGPNCKNELVSPNKTFNAPSKIDDRTHAKYGTPVVYVWAYKPKTKDNPHGKGDPWITEVKDGSIKWFGSSGTDGNKEYAQVQKGCEDTPQPNYPGFEKDVISGCANYVDPVNTVWYYGQKVGENGESLENITWVNDNEVKTIDNATYLGPSDEDIYCDNEVWDDAGNLGGGTANRITINIDYVPPECEEKVKLTYGAAGTFFAKEWDCLSKDENGRRRYSGKNNLSDCQNTELYPQPAEEPGTKNYITPMAQCKSDEGSGCLPYNGTVTINGKSYNSWQTFEYKGGDRESQEVTEAYAFDYARNITKCTDTFSLKQDRQAPVYESCTYKASYVKDGDSTSYIDITVTGIEDPVAPPDNYASGLDLEKSYINNGIRLYGGGRNGYRNMFYYIEDDYYQGVRYYRTNADGEQEPVYWQENDYDQPYGFSDYYNVTGSWGSRPWGSYLRRWTDEDGSHARYYDRGLWHDWFPTNTFLADQESENAITGSKMYKDPDGTIHIHAPLTCAGRKSRPYPIIRLYDQSGNYTEDPCTPETPADDVLIPACCDAMQGEERCEEWVQTECSKPCGGGEQHEETTCRATSRYRDTKICKYQKTRNQEECHTMDCCSDTIEKSTNGCVNGFETDNPCSYGQEEKYEISAYNGDICVKPHIVICQNDPIECKRAKEEAITNGGEIPVEVGQDIQFYISEEHYHLLDNGKEVLLHPVRENGKIVPFEFFYVDEDLGGTVPYCDMDTAKEYMKEPYKSDESITECSQIREEMFNVDTQNHLYKTIALYNYVASPSSCQLWMSGIANSWGDWVSFKSVDPNCKINGDNLPRTEDNCGEFLVDGSDNEILANITRRGSTETTPQTKKGCYIFVSWDKGRFTYNDIDNIKYKNQTYIAVKCEDETGKIGYCMESCDSGTCIYR